MLHVNPLGVKDVAWSSLASSCMYLLIHTLEGTWVYLFYRYFFSTDNEHASAFALAVIFGWYFPSVVVDEVSVSNRASRLCSPPSPVLRRLSH